MKEEEGRISPAILIVPVVAVLGLAAVAGLAFARAAPPKEYVCPYCGAKFSTEAEALAHIETEHPEEPPIVYYTCTICGATFTTQEELDSHILSEHPEAPPALGMITLYITGVTAEEWTVGWYYAETDTYRRHSEYYPPAGFVTSWKRPSDPCTPPEPIDLNNLRVKIETYSEIHTCPLTGWLGSCSWGEYGPFIVEDGKEYTLDVATGVLSEKEVAPPTGEILDITWWDGESYRLLTEPIPANTYITYRFRVKNTGNTIGAFKVGYSWYSEFHGDWIWAYSPTVDIEADTEGNIDWELFSGPGTYTITFHLFSNDNDVDSLTVTITVV